MGKYRICAKGLTLSAILYLAIVSVTVRFRPMLTTSANKIDANVKSNTQGLHYRTLNMDSNSKTIEVQRLGDLVHRRLLYLQNPKNCSATKKIFCSYNQKQKVGYGSQMHDWIFCLIAAYATRRTLVIESREWHYAEGGLETLFLPLSTNCLSTKNQEVKLMRDLSNVGHIQVVQLPRFPNFVKVPNYYPFAIPEDIADEISRVHKNPSGWWIGQFLFFITRQNQFLADSMEQFIVASGFRRTIVGVHVRRTDKVSVTKPHDLKEYMRHVDAWFDNYEKIHYVDQRRVYLASDDTNVLIQARESYPNYTFVTNTNASALAKSRTTRYSESSLLGLVLDIHLLSMCDFFVCTLSSNVGRLVYQLMHVRYWDAPDRIKSLDNEYSFSGRLVKKDFVVQNRNKVVSGDITIVKDTIKNPLKPMVSNDNKKGRVKMPTYPEVPRR